MKTVKLMNGAGLLSTPEQISVSFTTASVTPVDATVYIETLDKATQLKAKEPSSNGKTDAKKSEPKDEGPKAHDEAVKKLDESGRSMIEDDL